MVSWRGNDITAKVMALLLAAVLWVYVTNEQNPPSEQAISVRLEIRNLQNGLMVSDGVDAVKIKVRGPRSLLVGLRPENFGAYIDLKGLEEGRHTVPVKVFGPQAVEITDVTPEQVSFHLEPYTVKQVPVQPKFSGTPGIGSTLGKTTIKPDKVRIEGPRSRVESVEQAVAPVDITGVNKDITAEVPIKLVTNNGAVVEDLRIIPNKAQVIVPVVVGASIKTVDVKPIIFGELAPGYIITRITTDPGKVGIRGAVDVMETVDFLYTAPVDITNLTKDTVREVKLQLKEGISVDKGDVVKVRIQVAPAPGSQG